MRDASSKQNYRINMQSKQYEKDNNPKQLFDDELEVGEGGDGGGRDDDGDDDGDDQLIEAQKKITESLKQIRTALKCDGKTLPFARKDRSSCALVAAQHAVAATTMLLNISRKLGK